MRWVRCVACDGEVELGRVFCDCGAQAGPWPAGQAAPVAGTWLQMPLLAPVDYTRGTMPVVGESYRDDHIASVAGGQTEEGAKYRWHTAQLVQEDTNPYDEGKAVMVLIGGVLVGYIPSEDCPMYRRAMARAHGRPFTVRALITGGYLRGTGPERFGVELCMDESFKAFDPHTDPFLPGSYTVTITGLKPEVEATAARSLQPLVHLAPSGGGVVVGCDGVWWGSLSKAMVARYVRLLLTVTASRMPVTATGVLTKKEGKRKAHVLLPSEYTCGLLIGAASR